MSRNQAWFISEKLTTALELNSNKVLNVFQYIGNTFDPLEFFFSFYELFKLTLAICDLNGCKKYTFSHLFRSLGVIFFLKQSHGSLPAFLEAFRFMGSMKYATLPCLSWPCSSTKTW